MHKIREKKWLVLAVFALFYGQQGVLLAADAPKLSVKIDEWDVASGAFPHDPALTPDGIACYTGQQNHTIGRLDPATGKVTDFKLPAGSWPIPSRGGVVRNIVVSADGKALWLACSGVGKLARVTVTHPASGGQ